MSSRADSVAPLHGGVESQPERTTQRRWISSGWVAPAPRPTSARSKSDKISISSAQVAARPSTAAPHHHHLLRQQQQESSGAVARRPMSAKHRPLSGNVFLKKTVKNGWVACSVQDEEEEWLGEEGLDDEWEDEGEGWGSLTLLDGLLKSKKLMNSKRVQHVDWTAGEIAIPEFHCQRCRDHWYGLTSYPCDEEMARLIREGLWATGQGPVDRELLLGGRGSLVARDRRHLLKEGGAGGGDKLNLPPIVDRTDSGSSLDGSRSGGGVGDEKKGRRITFNMQTEEFRYSRDGGVGGVRTEGRRGSEGVGLDKGTGRQSGEEEESERSSHLRGVGSSHSISSRTVGQHYGESGSEGLVQLTGDKVPEGLSQRLEKADLGHSRQDGPLSGLDGRGPEGGRGRNGSRAGNTSSHGDSSGQGSTRVNDDGLNRHQAYGGNDELSKYGVGGAHVDGGVRLSRGVVDSGERHVKGGGGVSHSRTSPPARTKDTSSASLDGRSRAVGREEGYSGVGAHRRQGSDSSEESGCEGEGGGSRADKATIASSDSGRHVRVQGAGFIARASSPTGSEWGDPTHARMFISNTACSSRAGSSLGGRVQSDELGKSRSDPGLLQEARPKLKADDFIWGPPLTRAFTFSYHRQLKPVSQPAGRNSRAKTTKGRKK